MRAVVLTLFGCLNWLIVLPNQAGELVPKYKPSARAPQPIAITSNAYGFSRSAPEALEIGDTAPTFTLDRAGGGKVALQDKLKHGPVVLIFYRGHW
ncbi:MAG: hypothetical protein AAF541_14005 [Pseudomonadota bacterium]